jgi:hypothetical protein
VPVPACLQRYPFVVVYNDAKWNLEKRFSDFAELDAALDTYFEKDEDTTVRLTAQCALRARRARMCVFLCGRAHTANVPVALCVYVHIWMLPWPC